MARALSDAVMLPGFDHATEPMPVTLVPVPARTKPVSAIASVERRLEGLQQRHKPAELDRRELPNRDRAVRLDRVLEDEPGRLRERVDDEVPAADGRCT